MVRILLLLLLSVSTVIPANAQVNMAEREINEIIQKFNVVGLSVAVVKNNKLVYTNAFGYKDLETKTPLAVNHIFRIASISKSFFSYNCNEAG